MNALDTRAPADSLTAAQRDTLREVLQARDKALREALALHQGSVTRVQHAREVLLQDGDDAPARDADREVDLALNDHESRELAAIGVALQRLDTESFGRCHDCGAHIAFARLLAAPEALRCIGCETEFERQGGAARPARL